MMQTCGVSNTTGLAITINENQKDPAPPFNQPQCVQQIEGQQAGITQSIMDRLSRIAGWCNGLGLFYTITQRV